MSYDPYNDYQGDNGGLGQDDFITQLIMAGLGGGQTPGNTSAQRLSYLKSFTDFLDVPVEAMFGQNAPQEPFQSQTRAVWGGNNELNQVFNAIDQNADPASALLAVGLKPATGYGADNSAYDQAYKAAVDYANERAQYSQAQTERKDYGMQNEYDLMGRPGEETLIRQIAGARKLKQPKASQMGMGGADRLKDTGMDATQSFQARRAAKNRITQAKGTMVRGEDNQDLMRRILAIKTMLGD